MLAASFESGCEPEAMGVATAPIPILSPGHVLIKVAASAVNRADTLQVILTNALIAIIIIS